MERLDKLLNRSLNRMKFMRKLLFLCILDHYFVGDTSEQSYLNNINDSFLHEIMISFTRNLKKQRSCFRVF